MSSSFAKPCTAFAGTRHLASGSLIDVALAVKAAAREGDPETVLVFDDASGRVVDLDLRGDTAEIVARLAAQGGSETAESVEGGGEAGAPKRGRPRLGVVAREVTLLPRHWDWLSAQPGGASQALRRLIDGARRADAGTSEARAACEAAYRFLTAMAGDFPRFEEAIRALFAGDDDRFAGEMADWPADVRAYAVKLSTIKAIDSGPEPKDSEQRIAG